MTDCELISDIPRLQTAREYSGRAISMANPLLWTHFRSMLRRVFNLELSSDFSETYASGLETVVVVSAVDAIDVAGDGAADALALFERLSAEGGELIVDGLKRLSAWTGRVEEHPGVPWRVRKAIGKLWSNGSCDD